MPDGLLYRGKYCGKSRLRTKIEEFGDDTRSVVTDQRSVKSYASSKKPRGKSAFSRGVPGVLVKDVSSVTPKKNVEYD